MGRTCIRYAIAGIDPETILGIVLCFFDLVLNPLSNVGSVEIARAVLVVDQEPSFTDEVVMIFGEGLL